MDRDPAHEIEAHVRRLWRHRGTSVPTPRRGPRPQLELDEILRVAVAIADAEGLSAVSTRAVAARLGRTAMALYPHVGPKESLLALMHDHASAMPSWDDPATGLADALEAWGLSLFEVYLTHPWLTRRPWSQATQGPNEQDWMERLLRILHRWAVPPTARSALVTMLYATVRATAETTAAYRRMDRSGIVAWRRQADATRRQIPDLRERYPLSTTLEPPTPDWPENPRAALVGAVHLLARGMSTAGPG
jgi:AcrR family transcriptional regulator